MFRPYLDHALPSWISKDFKTEHEYPGLRHRFMEYPIFGTISGQCLAYLYLKISYSSDIFGRVGLALPKDQLLSDIFWIYSSDISTVAPFFQSFCLSFSLFVGLLPC